jgi:hypothetical protein
MLSNLAGAFSCVNPDAKNDEVVSKKNRPPIFLAEASVSLPSRALWMEAPSDRFQRQADPPADDEAVPFRWDYLTPTQSDPRAEEPLPFDLSTEPNNVDEALKGLAAFLQDLHAPSLEAFSKLRQARLPKMEKSPPSSSSSSEATDSIVEEPPAPRTEHQKLLSVFKTPYRFTLMSPEQAFPHMSPAQAGEALKTAQTVTVGDMHASYHKLVETLVAADMVEMPREAAKKFVQLANDPANYSMEMEEFGPIYEELKQIVPQIKWKGGDRQLILIGDMLSDRGPLDTIILDLVKHLSHQAPNSIVRIASNHDHNVLTFLMTGGHDIAKEQVVSLTKACHLAVANQTQQGLVTDYFDYLGKSKLLHYDAVSKTLFSHAPISKTQLGQVRSLMTLGRRFRISPLAEGEEQEPLPLPASLVKRPKELIRFVNGANQFYREYIEENRRIYCSHNAETEPEAKAEGEALLSKIQVMRNHIEPKLVEHDGFLWTRNTLDDEEELPFREAGVKTLVHGHDSQSAQGSMFSLLRQGAKKHPDFTVVNLDQTIRKGSVKSGPTEESPLFVLR